MKTEDFVNDRRRKCSTPGCKEDLYPKRVIVRVVSAKGKAKAYYCCPACMGGMREIKNC